MDGFDAIPMFSKKKLRILESIRTIQMGSTKNIVLVMRLIGSTDLQSRWKWSQFKKIRMDDEDGKKELKKE